MIQIVESRLESFFDLAWEVSIEKSLDHFRMVEHEFHDLVDCVSFRALNPRLFWHDLTFVKL